MSVDISMMSLMERIALLPPAERDDTIGGLSDAELADPRLWLRPSQLEVLDDTASIIVYAAGRGAGKTKVGASWVNEKAKVPGTRIHIVARTVPDVRDVCVQGESGIMASATPDFKPDYMPSVRRILWPNGSIAMTFSAEVPDMLRGPQAHYTWCDELATFKAVADTSGATIWDNIVLSTRLGARPQILATTTPRRTRIVRELFRDAADKSRRVSLHGGSTLENRANLSPEYLTNMIAMYEGTELAQQELYGLLIDEIAGAMWREDDIRYRPVDPTLDSRSMVTLIGVDPGLTTGGDATGIVTIRGTLEPIPTERRIWVVRDDTEPGGGGISPDRWAARVAAVWHEERDATGRVPIVVAEKNVGGELVSTVIHQLEEGAGIPIALVHAKGSKAQRAEPIVLGYRRGRIAHAEELPDLEEEMKSWEPAVSGWSPGHIDALVHACRALTVDEHILSKFGSLRVAAGPVQDLARDPFRNGRMRSSMSGANHRNPDNPRERH